MFQLFYFLEYSAPTVNLSQIWEQGCLRHPFRNNTPQPQSLRNQGVHLYKPLYYSSLFFGKGFTRPNADGIGCLDIQ